MDGTKGNFVISGFENVLLIWQRKGKEEGLLSKVQVCNPIMGKDPAAPFIVGQKAEARSFERGFRGAWFRCELKKICQSKGQLRALVDYFDFTEEKPEWLILYQDPPYHSKSKDKRKTLMIRPEYPVICHENEIADVNALQEVVLVVNGSWKVGDMVDWFNCDCYWPGRITELLGTKNAKIELIRPPVGEGGCYDDVSVEELRPTLEWSIEAGWTVPISEDHEEPCCCAQLIHPTRQEFAGVKSYLGKRRSRTVESLTKRQPDEGCSDMSIGESSAEKKLSHVEELTRKPPDEGCSDGIIGEASSEKKISHIGKLTERPPDEGCSYGNIREASVDNRTLEDLHQFDGSYQNVMSFGGLDTLEAAVLGLEELSNKVKWLKRHMKDAIPLSKSGDSSWEFVEHRG